MQFSLDFRLPAIATLLMVILPINATAGPKLEVFLPGQTEPFSSQQGEVIAWGTVWGGYDDVSVLVPNDAQGGVIAIAAGRDHTVALKADGRVVAWGRNKHGQTTVPVAAQSGVVAIAAGLYHTVALKQNGSVIAWGSNWDGQSAVPADAQSGVVAIAAGWLHALALKQGGGVIAWGGNASGQMTVPDAAQTGIIAIAATDSYSVAIKPSTQSFGKVAFGDFSEHEFILRNAGGADLTLTSISLEGPGASEFQIVGPLQRALTSGNSITLRVRYRPDTPGSDFASLSITSTDSTQPQLRIPLSGTGLATRLGVTDSAGPATSASMGSRVVTWGWKYSGTAKMPVAAQSGVVAIAAGYAHTVALMQDGSVIAWGSNSHGQTSVPVAAQRGVVAIAAGEEHTVALKQDGGIIAWGGDYFGETSVPVAAQSGVAAIAAGFQLTVALKQSGGVIAWGSIWNDSAYASVSVPVAARSGVAAIAAGGAHIAALKQDGSVIAWGDNDYGQIHVPAAARSGVMAVSASNVHTVALKEDGRVIAWGNNWSGQTSVPAAAQSSVVAIAAGGGHTVALKQDGGVIAWGHNGYGQTDVPSAARSGVVAIAAGQNHTVALVEATGDFGTRQLGSVRDHRIQLSNTGNLPLTITSLSIEGPDADQFQVLGTVPGSLAVNASGPLTLRFAPTRIGSMQATLTIASNDPATPVYTLELAGSGGFSLAATKRGDIGSSFTYAPLRVERATGLMLQTVSFTNITGIPLPGLKLILSKVAPGVRVYSSSQGKVPGTYEVIYSNPIGAGETISFDLVYADPQRRTAEAMNPVSKAEALLVPEPDFPSLAGTLAPLLRVLVTPPGPLLEWNAVPRATYVVEYSDDGGQTWFSAVHRLSTSGRRMIWIDRGQPETKTKPLGVPNKKGGRSYRIRKAS